VSDVFVILKSISNTLTQSKHTLTGTNTQRETIHEEHEEHEEQKHSNIIEYILSERTTQPIEIIQASLFVQIGCPNTTSENTLLLG
jgi:arginine/lysine/ornithine decarboxylase